MDNALDQTKPLLIAFETGESSEVPVGWKSRPTRSWRQSFILPKPPGITEISQICLRVSGVRVLPDGRSQGVTAGTICEVSEPVLAVDTPSWWEPVMVPVWSPDIREDTRLKDGIVAHVSVQTDRPRRRGQAQNALVVFPDLHSGVPFQNLIRGLELMRRQQAAPSVVLVMPAGSFDSTRRELEALLAPFPTSIARRLQVVEDIEGGWSRTFDVSETPAVFLINARHEFVWKSVGELYPAGIAAALDQHVVATSPPRFVPSRARVATGDRAPDLQFRDDRGDDGALHRLLGRSVLLTFWHSASAPCLAELRRLQAMLDSEPRGPRSWSPSTAARSSRTSRVFGRTSASRFRSCRTGNIVRLGRSASVAGPPRSPSMPAGSSNTFSSASGRRHPEPSPSWDRTEFAVTNSSEIFTVLRFWSCRKPVPAGSISLRPAPCCGALAARRKKSRGKILRRRLNDE